MERLTSNKEVSDMSMIELAHNSCYADDKRNARYRDYEMDMDARDFARNLMVTLAKDEMPISDTEFDEEILDDLAIDPFSDVRGLIALFYRNLWAMANLRETLKKYEDLEEQDRLVKLPCKIGTEVYDIAWWDNAQEKVVVEGKTYYRTVHKHKVTKLPFTYSDIDNFGKTVFLTEPEAKERLKELRGGENGK